MCVKLGHLTRRTRRRLELLLLLLLLLRRKLWLRRTIWIVRLATIVVPWIVVLNVGGPKNANTSKHDQQALTMRG